jgi:hypothetical protein
MHRSNESLRSLGPYFQDEEVRTAGRILQCERAPRQRLDVCSMVESRLSGIASSETATVAGQRPSITTDSPTVASWTRSGQTTVLRAAVQRTAVKLRAQPVSFHRSLGGAPRTRQGRRRQSRNY